MRTIFRIFVPAVVASAVCCCTQTTPVTTPTMGWSSWNAYEVNISDSIIMHQADMLIETGLAEAGYNYVNIDDGYFGGRKDDGSLITHPVRFPNGMNHVVEHIHGLGLKAGIYSDAGSDTCGSMGNNDILGVGSGLYNHDFQDMDLFFNDWDFDFIKIDYCGGRKLNLDEEQRYTEICHNIDSISHKKIVVNICRWNYPGNWVKEISDSWRISGDIRPKWSSIKHIVERNMYLSSYSGDGHYNDMDMLAVGYNLHPSSFQDNDLGLSYQEEEAHFGMWCIMSSPLLLGCVLEYIPEETMAIITNPELIALNQDPLGLQAYIVSRQEGAYVFTKDILTLNGKERAVALYNPEDKDITITATAEMLCLQAPLKVRDLNRRVELGEMNKIEMTLPAHSARILKVQGARRCEQTLYEAEWGWCPVFDNTRPLDGAKYITYEPASGWAMVAHIGESEENKLCWRDVRVGKDGNYTLEFTLLPGTSDAYPAGEGFNEVVVNVNGKDIVIGNLVCNDSEPLVISTNVKLNKGLNSISIGNPTTIIPPVDKMTVRRR